MGDRIDVLPRHENPGFGARAGFRELRAHHEVVWTVSNGSFVLEATLYVEPEDALGSIAGDCEAMMRTVRFEGPS